MGEHAESDDVLESFGDCVVSPCILLQAFTLGRDMCKDNGIAAISLNLCKLINQPAQLVSRVVEGVPGSEVLEIAQI